MLVYLHHFHQAYLHHYRQAYLHQRHHQLVLVLLRVSLQVQALALQLVQVLRRHNQHPRLPVQACHLLHLRVRVHHRVLPLLRRPVQVPQQVLVLRHRGQHRHRLPPQHHHLHHQVLVHHKVHPHLLHRVRPLQLVLLLHRVNRHLRQLVPQNLPHLQHHRV